MKRNKKIWNGRKRCSICNKGFNTWGGIKVLFGLFRIKKWEHKCKCYAISTSTKGCKNTITIVGEEKDDDKRTD
jgi:hypothetical protein